MNKDKVITLKVTKVMYAHLAAIADKEGRTISDVIRRIIDGKK